MKIKLIGLFICILLLLSGCGLSQSTSVSTSQNETTAQQMHHSQSHTGHHPDSYH